MLCSFCPLPCYRYYWTFNGTRVDTNVDKLTVDENTGTLRIGPRFGEDQSGEYQCYAFNDYGTAMTPILKILATGIALSVFLKVKIYLRA